MDDIIHFKKLLFGNSSLDFNNELFMDYFVKQLKNYDYAIWSLDNYNIYNNINKIFKYLTNIPNVVETTNIDYVEKLESQVNIKYRKEGEKIFKITKIRDIKKIDGYDLYIQKNTTTYTEVGKIPSNFNVPIEKVYYKVNDYIEIVITNLNELNTTNNFLKINILNKHLWNDYIFSSLFKIIFNLYCLIYKKSSVFSNYFNDKLMEYFNFTKSQEFFLNFDIIINGNLLTTKDCNYSEDTKYYSEPKLFYSYPIINKNDFYVLYNKKYQLIFTFYRNTRNIDIIPLNLETVWFKKEDELQIIRDMKSDSDNYIFGAYVDYKNNKAYIYDVYKFENLTNQVYNMPYKNRYNYIELLMSKIPGSNFIFEKIQINPVTTKDKIYENFKFMIDSNSIGVKYISNEPYNIQMNYNWIYYHLLSLTLYVKDNKTYVKNNSDEIFEVELKTKLKYTEERNYLFNYDSENNLLIQHYQKNYDTYYDFELEDFLKYIYYKYNPYDIILENNFDLTKTIFWKLKQSFNGILVDKLEKIDRIYKKGFIPIVNDISMFNEFIKRYYDSEKTIGILYIDEWKMKQLKLNDKNIEKINMCKKINVDKFISKYTNKFIINFDDYINLSCINNIPNIISILILTLSKNTYISISPSQNTDIMESKIIFSDLKTFAKHHKLRKNISILKKSEILELIQSSGYTLNDVKNFVEGEKIEKKKSSSNEEESPSSCSEKQDTCENSEFSQYMYTDAEMEFYRKYVRQCTSQLKQTAFKRNLIDSLEYNIDRKSLICLLVKKQCKSDTKMKPIVRKLKTKLQSIFPDETYQMISDIYKTEENNYQCKGYNIINYNNILMLRCDNYDVVEFMLLTSEGFNFLGNNEKDYIVRSFKNLVKNCLDTNKLYNISNNEIFNITPEFESTFKQTIFFEINKFLDNENILQYFIVYSLFLGIYINVYEYNDNSTIKLLFSSEKIPQIYNILKEYFSKKYYVYNIIITSNSEKLDFGFHIERVSNNIIFTYNFLIN